MVRRLWTGMTFFNNPLHLWGRGHPDQTLSREEEALLAAFGEGLGRLHQAPPSSPSSSPALPPAPDIPAAPVSVDPPEGLVKGEVYGPDNPIPPPPGGYPPVPRGWGGTAEAHYRYLLVTGQMEPG